MTTRAARVLEAIEAAEALALAASPGPWHANPEHDEVLAVDDITVCDGFALGSRQLRATVDHIAMHDPAAVLRRCAADRKILALHPKGSNGLGGWSCMCCEERTDYGHSDGEWPCETLTALAEAYGVPLEQEETDD